MTYFLQDIEVKHNGKTFTLVPSKSGDFETVKSVCQTKGLKVFEPRDNDTFHKVFKEAQKAGQVIVYLGLQRKWSHAEYKWEP